MQRSLTSLIVFVLLLAFPIKAGNAQSKSGPFDLSVLDEDHTPKTGLLSDLMTQLNNDLPTEIEQGVYLRKVSLLPGLATYKFTVENTTKYNAQGSFEPFVLLPEDLLSERLQTVLKERFCKYKEEDATARLLMSSGYNLLWEYYDQNSKLITQIHPDAAECKRAIEYGACGQIGFKMMAHGDESLSPEEKKYQEVVCPKYFD